MSNGFQNTPQYDALMRALAKSTYPISPPKVRVVTKRTKHSERFAERIQKNAEIADKLIEIIKELNRKPDTEPQVDKLIDVVKDILENNAKLREQVGEALQDIPTHG